MEERSGAKNLKTGNSGWRSRFSVAVHILKLLATEPGEPLTSEFTALSIGTNPVVIRRQLAPLYGSELVESKGSLGGG